MTNRRVLSRYSHVSTEAAPSKFYRKRKKDNPRNTIGKTESTTWKLKQCLCTAAWEEQAVTITLSCSSLAPTVQEGARPKWVCEMQHNYPLHDPSLGHPRDMVSMPQKVKGAHRNFLVLKMHFSGALPHEIFWSLWEHSLLAWWNTLSPRNTLTTHPISTAAKYKPSPLGLMSLMQSPLCISAVLTGNRGVGTPCPTDHHCSGWPNGSLGSTEYTSAWCTPDGSSKAAQPAQFFEAYSLFSPQPGKDVI